MSPSSEKRNEILELVAAGKLTAAEAADLFREESEQPADSPSEAPSRHEIKQEIEMAESEEPVKRAAPSWLHIRVSDLKSGKGKVTVNIPLRLAKYGLGIGRRFAPELEDLDWDELVGAFGAQSGVLVDVHDEEDGEHVQIFVD